MNGFTKALCVGVLAVAAIATRAEAGRTGGPAVDGGTLQPNQEAWVDVPFDQGWAVVTLVAVPATVDLTVTDDNGHVTTGQGAGLRRIAAGRVYSAGVFRIHVRNNGSVPSEITVHTN